MDFELVCKSEYLKVDPEVSSWHQAAKPKPGELGTARGLDASFFLDETIRAFRGKKTGHGRAMVSVLAFVVSVITGSTLSDVCLPVDGKSNCDSAWCIRCCL